MKKEEIISKYQVDVEKGLSESQVDELRKIYGPNKLKEKKKKSWFIKFLEQFKDVMILILIAAAIVSFVIAIINKEPSDFFEPILILIIVIMNALMGVFQEAKAERALDALKSLSSPHARVIRDGVEKIIKSEELVPGDIIKFEAGDFVPADSLLLESSSLKSEESMLTGESLPSEKDAKKEVKEDASLGDQTNKVFSGCSITYGSGKAIVVSTGMNTEIGKIANLLDEDNSNETPLQRRLAQLGKYLGILALVCCAIIFVVGLVSGTDPLDIFMISVSLAVSAIPEGLPVIVTIVLSIGVQRMAKKNALIRKLPAVETLGSASIICSDKTGTLTQNRMTLVKAYVDGSNKLEDISSNNSEEVRRLLNFATLCSDGSIVVNEDDVSFIGDPTETSIIYASYKNGFKQEDLNKKYPRQGEIPFDSDRKLMTSINKIDGKNIVIVKGAFDIMMSRCVEGDLEYAKKINDQMSENALRVLALSYKEIDDVPSVLIPEEIEKDLIFLGLVGMIDPPREEVKESVKLCKKAGIKPIMITGDHVVTARAIAMELGIFNEGDKAITGKELDQMNDSELDEELTKISVYARVSPENKIRIVKAWQRKNQVVAMTGDGVNDAPALKAADIGCAMGITGTDVAKKASAMTLTDDNFSTIVDAVKEGRGIYSNIKKVIGFLLSTNIGEVITVFLAMIIWQTSPLLSMQLLWVNLVTDSLPAIALGMEPIEKDIMDQKPRPKNEGIFANGLGIRIALQGVMIASLTLVGFKIGEIMGGSLMAGQTLAFMVLALSQVVHSYNMRSEKSLFEIGFFKNKKLNLASLASILLMALVLFSPLRIPFGLVILPWELYLIGLGLIITPFIIMELAKLIIKLFKRKKK
ncbi:MAG: calcium-translocating P-type ATPase, PMCA-type [Bacillales bacterium]|nr:calcium-translocating P-type ATPase, PMCA-type [Bacillales bacterium]